MMRGGLKFMVVYMSRAYYGLASLGSLGNASQTIFVEIEEGGIVRNSNRCSRNSCCCCCSYLTYQVIEHCITSSIARPCFVVIQCQILMRLHSESGFS